MSLLRLSKIGKQFGTTIALQDVNLEIDRGEVHALIGENGAGKSTLMNILAGILQPDSGAIQLDDIPYEPSSPLAACRQGISLIHQELLLFPHLTVSENILMGMENSRWGWVDKKACLRETSRVLEIFHHPEIHPDRPVAELSIAARQIVEICRAIASKARLILMDEPTSSLQREDVERLFDLIRSMRQQNLTVIYISHFLEEVREIADGYTVLRDGRTVDSGELSGVKDDNLVASMVGRPVRNLFPVRRQANGEALLQVEGISAPPRLKKVTFQLHRGEILGIGGLIGSGRTQLVRTIFGLTSAQSGNLVVKKKRISASKGTPLSRITQGMGYLSEDRKGEGLAVTLSVADNITLSSLSAFSRWGWLGLESQSQASHAWMKELNIRALSPFQRVLTLSGGNQQKVALARLLHQEADILLLDEPTRGIDIGSKIQMYESISQCAQQGKAVLLVSSYLPELFGLCHRLGVMSRGRLSQVRSIEEWTPELVMQVAVKGEE